MIFCFLNFHKNGKFICKIIFLNSSRGVANEEVKENWSFKVSHVTRYVSYLWVLLSPDFYTDCISNEVPGKKALIEAVRVSIFNLEK